MPCPVPRALVVGWALTVGVGGVPAYAMLGWRGVGIVAASAALGQAGYLLAGWAGCMAAAVAAVLLGLLA
jgi:hypothetical protein